MSRMPKVHNEVHLKTKVKKLLDDHGWFWWMPPANGFGKSGVSDIHCVKPGLFMVIETKDTGNTPTALQKGFLETITAAEHFALVVHPETLGTFNTFLNALDTSIQLQSQNLNVPAEIGGPMLEAIRILTEPYKT